jgi:hypothetical protein
MSQDRDKSMLVVSIDFSMESVSSLQNKANAVLPVAYLICGCSVAKFRLEMSNTVNI